MDLFKSYEDKRVLICGASGMSGQHLFDLMEMLSAKVTGTCLTRADLRFRNVDFCSPTDAEEIIKEGWDYVFICCAKTYNAKMCREKPESMVLPNIQMVSNILSNCLKYKAGKVLYISSATVYQPSFRVLSEEDLDLNQNPHDIYMGIGWVKRYLEKMCEFYSTLGLKTVVVRPTNIYGEYDKSNTEVQHVIPALIERALRKENPYTIYGNGRAVKDFIYAQDFVRDCAKVAAHYETPDPINICSGEETSISEVAKKIAGIVGYKPTFICTSQEVDKVPYKRISRNKFVSLFGKDTYTTLQKGLEETTAWYSLLPQTQS